MVNAPLISVIIPVYNVEKYLKKCVDSVLNQTYDNLEIILVDDGSPDNCGKMCDDYAGKDSRIKVVHKENGGLPSARNAGIDAANGEFITFVDSDDYIHEKMVETLYNNLCSTDSDISVCGFQAVKEDTPMKSGNADSKGIITLTKYDIPDFSKISPFIGARNAWSKLYKKGLLDLIRFNNDIVKLEDVSFSYKIYTVIDKICFDTIPLYYYLIRSGSIMNGESYPVEYIAETWNDVLRYYDMTDLDDEFRQTLIRFIICEKVNNILDAYYLVSLRKGSNESKRKIVQLFKEQKKTLNDYKLWTAKMRIFDFSRPLFVVAMRVYILLRHSENELMAE